jgi:hypothetical protein
MAAFRKRLSVALILTALLSVPVLILSGVVVLFANPCFFRQFPQQGCPQASVLPGSPGWVLIWLGIAVAAVLGLAGAVAKGLSRQS